MHSPLHRQLSFGASHASLLPILDPAFELQDLPLPEPPHFALTAEEREASYAVLYGTLALPWIRGEGTFAEVVKPAHKASYPRTRSGWSVLQALQHYFRILLSKWQVHHMGGCHQGYLQSLEDDLHRYHGVELPACWSVRQYVKGRYGMGALKTVREGECADAPAVDENHRAPKPTPYDAIWLVSFMKELVVLTASGAGQGEGQGLWAMAVAQGGDGQGQGKREGGGWGGGWGRVRGPHGGPGWSGHGASSWCGECGKRGEWGGLVGLGWRVHAPAGRWRIARVACASAYAFTLCFQWGVQQCPC